MLCFLSPLDKFHRMNTLFVPQCATWIAAQSAENASFHALLGHLLSWKLSWWHSASQYVQFFFCAQHSKLCVSSLDQLLQHI